MTRHLLDEVLDAKAGGTAGTCEAVWIFLGIEAVCGDRAIGKFRRACVHEHVRDGRLCREHAETPEKGLCRACYYELPGDASHECPISIAEVTA